MISPVGKSHPSVPTPAELATLVDAVAKAADRAAFGELFGHFAPRIKAFLVRSGARVDMAEDLTQEAMVTLWNKARAFDASRASVTTWVYTIARNLWVDQCRRAAHPAVASHQQAWLIDLPALSMDESPEEFAQFTQRQSHIGRALAALPEEQAEALRMAYFDYATHEQIATRLGLPLGTVKSRIRLAITALSKLLDDLL